MKRASRPCAAARCGGRRACSAPPATGDHPARAGFRYRVRRQDPGVSGMRKRTPNCVNRVPYARGLKRKPAEPCNGSPANQRMEFRALPGGQPEAPVPAPRRNAEWRKRMRRSPRTERLRMLGVAVIAIAALAVPVAMAATPPVRVAPGQTTDLKVLLISADGSE